MATPQIDSIVHDILNGIALDFIRLFVCMGQVQQQQGDFARKKIRAFP